MDAGVVVVYFVFSIIYLKTLYEKKEIEVEQALFKVMADQSKSEIEILRKSQEQSLIYRHDLRHHINFINACISENNIENAQMYMKKICENLEASEVISYSENETINLIISSYAAKAEERKIHSEIKISAVDFEGINTTDLCSLLSNALENAINACEKAPIELRYIKLKMYSKNNKLCIDIRNTYHKEPVFENGFPISMEEGHGYGTKSMAHIIEKYNGIYQFYVKDGFFIFQATA